MGFRWKQGGYKKWFLISGDVSMAAIYPSIRFCNGRKTVSYETRHFVANIRGTKHKWPKTARAAAEKQFKAWMKSAGLQFKEQSK